MSFDAWRLTMWRFGFGFDFEDFFSLGFFEHVHFSVLADGGWSSFFFHRPMRCDVLFCHFSFISLGFGVQFGNFSRGQERGLSFIVPFRGHPRNQNPFIVRNPRFPAFSPASVLCVDALHLHFPPEGLHDSKHPLLKEEKNSL